jgi:hypothetical protein
MIDTAQVIDKAQVIGCCTARRAGPGGGGRFKARESGSPIRYRFSSYTHILTADARFSDSMAPQPAMA